MTDPQRNFNMLRQALEPIQQGDYQNWWWALVGIICFKHDITGKDAVHVLYDEDPDTLTEYYLEGNSPIQTYDSMFEA